MAETISMPKLGFDMREGVLVRWVKEEGDDINKGDVLAEIETDKATVEVESSASGVVRKLLASQGDSIPIGAVIAIIGTKDEKIDEGLGNSKTETHQNIGQKPGLEITNQQGSLEAGIPDITPVGMLKASPLARKIANDSRMDLGKIQGTGPAGRIIRRDVEAALATFQQTISPQISNPSSTIAKETVDFGQMPYANQDKKISTSKLRQAIGRRLVESKQTSPHFYVSHEYKMDVLNSLRKQVNGVLPDGQKISVNDFILKAASLALREFPNLNSTLMGTEIIQHSAVNVGVAVTVPGGLLTVVVKDTDQKSLVQISAEVKSMAARAREGKVKPEDVDGSTFSTSNLGMYDVENFIAIINPPEAAILAIGSAREMPVIENGQITIGSRMKCTISVDHRISDGAEAAQFMQALSKYLEEPLRLLI